MSPVWPGYRDHAGPGVTEVGVLNPLRVLGPVPGDALNPEPFPVVFPGTSHVPDFGGSGAGSGWSGPVKSVRYCF